MKETMERTALGEVILKHWREHCPQMVRDLEKENRLDQAVFEDAGEDGRLAVRTGVGEEDGISRGVGAGAGGVGVAARGEQGREQERERERGSQRCCRGPFLLGSPGQRGERPLS